MTKEAKVFLCAIVFFFVCLWTGLIMRDINTLNRNRTNNGLGFTVTYVEKLSIETVNDGIVTTVYYFK